MISSTKTVVCLISFYFREAVQCCGIPSRIRCVLGVENVDIARFMLATRGVGQNSVLSGSSTHNQRSKRLWRDVRRVVLRHYQNIFNYLKAYNLLDPLLRIYTCLPYTTCISPGSTEPWKNLLDRITIILFVWSV